MAVSVISNRLRTQPGWITVLPIVIILLIVGMTFATALTPGQQPREAVFDLFQRLDTRLSNAAGANGDYALIQIDRESTDRVGPWPWPRTSLAELVNAAQEAGAKNIILTVPVDGPDPLSPEVVGRYWFDGNAGIDTSIASAVQALPSHDIALARAMASASTALAIGQEPAYGINTGQGWVRTDIQNSDWFAVMATANTEYISLPSTLTRGSLSRDLAASGRTSVSALPADPDGIVRRVRLVWNAYGQPVPSTALAALLINDSKILAVPHDTLLQTSGHPLRTIAIDETRIPLDRQSSAIIYMPANVTIPTVPAWRALAGNESWTQLLRGKTVFIGENVTPASLVMTARGEMSLAQLHALVTDQLASGASISRPEWAGFVEAGLALILGVLTILIALVFSRLLSTTIAVGVSIVLFVVTWVIFANGSMQIDPIPGILAVLGSQLGIGLGFLASSVVQDDRVRGAFHGALPTSAMIKLQKNKGSALLDGTRRQVTVLSCSVRLPEDITADFLHKPDEYIQFRAQTNDKLRQTILALGGTVDHGEDGRLLGYWNVPEENSDHIEKACSCALQMIEDMNILAQDLETAQSSNMARIVDHNERSAFEQGHLEIGISSDICFAGPVGRGARNRYSVVGQAVAFAGNLRNRSRLYGPAIVCDETVFTALRHHFAFLDLDTLTVNDEKQPRPIYGLVGNPFLKASKAFRVMADTQRELVNAWRDGNLGATEAYLKKLEELPGTHQAYVSLYQDRIKHAHLEKQSTGGKKPENWDGSQRIMI